MQLLSKTGTEGGKVDGLGLIEGTVKPFKSNKIKMRVPHVGWNAVEKIEKTLNY